MFKGREFTFYSSKQQRNTHLLTVGHDPCFRRIVKNDENSYKTTTYKQFIFMFKRNLIPRYVHHHIQVIFIQTVVENLIFRSLYHFAWKFSWENIGRWSAEKHSAVKNE
jgi:hypothetical protein